MASKPGILTDWPWKSLGSFKYVILAPWVVHSIYTFIIKDGKERDPVYIWISLARYRTAKGNNRIVDKSIEFEQVDRKATGLDDQILLNGILFYVIYMILPGVAHMPLWRTDGVLLTILLHMGPVEFLYYWLHRALHHHYLYSRYHSHHHSSIVTEPITSVIHPLLNTYRIFMRKSSMAALFGYISYIDFMNNMGHCNFELIPKMYHSLHHTQFRTNYSLFMPIYDYIYGTMDKSSDALYEKSLIRPEELPHVVHLTHLVTPQSIYHLRLGFASLASKPYTSKWYVWAMWPVTCCSIMLTWTYGRTFILERNQSNKFNVQTLVVPKFKIQYLLKLGSESIDSLIEEAILKADNTTTKIIYDVTIYGHNSYGELYIHRNPKLKIKVVDGSSLAVVLNSIPKGTTQVLLRQTHQGCLFYCLRFMPNGYPVATSHKDEYEQLNTKLKNVECESKLLLSKNGLTKEEQMKASKGTLFIPFSQFPPKRLRKDCLYHTTPAMMPPKSFQNIDSCEVSKLIRAMSASRVAGVIHALEGWNVHECGNTMFNVEKIWEASLQHGFHPLTVPT
ncbi:hypothetical protein AAG906_029269 [Vitis piasezkii]